MIRVLDILVLHFPLNDGFQRANFRPKDWWHLHDFAQHAWKLGWQLARNTGSFNYRLLQPQKLCIGRNESVSFQN